MAEVPPFTGFGPDAMSFLDGLAVDNSKAYFDEHRSTYEQQVQGPLKSLIVSLGSELRSRVSRDIEFEPKVGKSMFRINRDVRFSTDKTPYNTYLDAVFWTGESSRTSPGFILRIAPRDVVVGVGVFGLADDRLERWRAAVIDDERGPELGRLIDEATANLRGASISEPRWKRVPKGLPADHPRADLLRYDGFHVSAELATPASVTSKRFVSWCVDRYEKLAGLHTWLVRELSG